MNLRRRRVAYGLAVVSVALATGTTSILQPWMGGSVSLLFFPAVIVPAAYGRYGPAVLAGFLAAASMAYFFIPPAFVLDLGVDDGIRLGVFVSVGAITAWLSAR